MQNFPTTKPETQALEVSRPTPGTGSSSDHLSEQADPRRILGVIINHWWLVLLGILLATAFGAIWSIVATPMYRASCRYEIMTDDRLRLGNQNTPAYISAEQVTRMRGRQIVILTGGSIRKQVHSKLAPKYQNALSNLMVDVNVKSLRESETMLDISVDAVSAEYALEFLRELLAQYQEVQRNRALETNESAQRSLWVEKKRLADELEEAQNILMKFQQEHSIRVSEAKQQFDDMFLAGLVQRQNTLRMERTMLETQFPFIQNANSATIQDVIDLTKDSHDSAMDGAGNFNPNSQDTSIANLMKSIPTADRAKNLGKMPAAPASWQEQEELVSRLGAEYQDLLMTYKPDHPKMIELQRQVAAAKRELVFGAETALKRLKSRYEALKIQEDALGKAASQWRSEASLSSADRAIYENQRSKVDHLKQLHDQVYAKILDNTANNSDSTINHMIDQPAAFPNAVRPNRLLIMTASIFFGLAFGIGLALLLDYLDTSMLDIMAIEERLGLPYLNSIPSWTRILPDVDLSTARVIVDRNKASLATEVYRSLRTGLESVIGAKPGYALAITSTEANEGKSMTVVNLSAAFSWTGKKILMIDGDLRRGRLHENIGLEKRAGLTEFLMGKIADWHEIILPTSYPNLSLIPVGTCNNTAPELLDSTRIKQLISEWGREYDLIIFDTAPIGRVVDAGLIGRACDGMLLVARHGICSFAGVRHAINRLKGVNLIGFIVNGIDTGGKQGYGSYYGYFRRFYNYGRYGYSNYNYYNQYYNKYDQYGYGTVPDEHKRPAGTAEGSSSETVPPPPSEPRT